MCTIRFLNRRELSTNQLSGSIPSTMGSLTNLQQLYDNHTKWYASELLALGILSITLWWFMNGSLFGGQVLVLESTHGNHSIDHWNSHQSSVPVRCYLNLDCQSRWWFYPLTQYQSVSLSLSLSLSLPVDRSFIDLIAWLQALVEQSTLGNHSIDHWVAHQSHTAVRSTSPTHSIFINHPSPWYGPLFLLITHSLLIGW